MMAYYQGDYYSGDPFFGAILAAAMPMAKRFFGKIPGLISRTPKQAMVLSGAPAAAGMATTAMARVMGGGGALARRAGAIVSKHPVLSAAGAAGTIGLLGGAGGRAMMERGVPERGFHVSKRTGALVRNRRMRVTNPRALHRAIRRAAGFARLARRVLRFTSPRPPRGRPVFRFHRKRK